MNLKSAKRDSNVFASSQLVYFLPFSAPRPSGQTVKMASMARSSAIAGPLAGPKLYEEYCGCEFTLQPKLVADIVDRLEAIEPVSLVFVS